MDFLDPLKKRAHRRRLLIGYILLAIALAMGTWILGVITFGYYYDRKTGTVIQNGLVFANASPVSADIYVNNVRQQSKTDTRLVLPDGQYTIQYKHEGYRDWIHSLTLLGGQVERLDYAFLFPTKLQSKDVELYGHTPTFATMSPDRHWLLTQQPGQILKIDLVDLTSGNTATSQLSLPSNLLTSSSDPNQTLQAVEWSTDNRHVLFKHHYGNSDEFIIVDREAPGSSFNINKTFNTSPSQVVMRDKHFDSLYIYNTAAGTLQIGDVKANKLTPLLTHVLAFKPYTDKTILFVSSDAQKTGNVTLKLYSNGSTYSMRELPVSNTYLLEIARYDNRWYMVASSESEGRTYIYRDPETTLKQKNASTSLLSAIVLNMAHPQFVSFSSSAQYLVVQSSNHFAVYDAEKDRRFYYDFEHSDSLVSHATWMNTSHLTLVSEGKLWAFDFDGTNQQILVADNAEFQPSFDPSYKWLYTIASSITVPGKPALIRTELVVK